VKTPDLKMTIGIVSSVSGVKTGGSVFFLKKIIPQLSRYFTVDLFIPERNHEAYAMWDEFGCSVRHLHTLPYHLSASSSYTLLYSLDNHLSAFLCRWYLALYPGIVLLQDKNFFRLECEALGHGSDSFELNRLVQSEYGEGSLPVGEQHIRQRNLEMYAELYPFLRTVIRSATGILAFGTRGEEMESGDIHPVSLHRSCFLEPGRSLVSKAPEASNTFCVLMESPFSRTALEILKIYPLKKTIGTFPLLLLVKTDSGGSPVSCSIVEEQEQFDLGTVSGLVVTGIRPYHGVRGIVCEAIEACVPVSCEYSGEYMDLNFNCIVFHGKEESLADRIRMVREMKVLPESIDSGASDSGIEALIHYIQENSISSNETMKTALEDQKSILRSMIDDKKTLLDESRSFFPELESEISQLQQQYATNAKIFF
jgi:hypothetical protein